MRVVKLLLAGTLLFTTELFSQSVEKPKLPTVVPPSPDAASLGKYGDIQVGAYTGIPKINIPIYSVRSRDASLDIDLSYHAGGIRVEEEASWVGLGWTLNAGGAITRSVRGFDDFLNTPGPKGYVYSAALPAMPSPSDEAAKNAYNVYLNNVCRMISDSEPDVFMFNFAGYSGKFFLKKKANGKIGVAFLSNNAKYKIDYDETEKKWTVWTPDGFKYEFQTPELMETWRANNPVLNSSFVRPDAADDLQKPMITAWYLDKITSPTGEQINFQYETHREADSKQYSSRSIPSWSESKKYCFGVTALPTATGTLCSPPGAVVNTLYGGKFGMVGSSQAYDNYVDFGCLLNWSTPWFAVPSEMCDNSHTFSGSYQVYFNVYLSSITYRNGRILFVRAARSDVEKGPNSAAGAEFASPERLDHIIVEAYRLSSYHQLKKIQLTHQYFNPGGAEQYLYRRLKLVSVNESNGNESVPPHIFDYENVNLPAKNSRSRDHWGYYNGANNEFVTNGTWTLIPKIRYRKTHLQFGSFQGANRDADEPLSQAAVLKRITYPTKGYTDFTYEANTFNVDQAGEGKPVKQIIVAVESPSNTYPLSGKVFEVKEDVEITLNVEFKCLGLSCTGGSPPMPSVNCASAVSSAAGTSYYYQLRRLVDGYLVGKGYTFEFYCAIGGGACPDPINISHTSCGISKTEKIQLNPGRYFIKASPIEGFSSTVVITYEQKEVVNALTTNLIKKGGGLRIKSMLTHDGYSTANDQIISYKYETVDEFGVTRSTGKLMSFPRYAYGIYNVENHALDASLKNVYASILASSFSNVPLGSSAQGNAVGYDRVEEIRGKYGQNGTVIRYYKNEPEEQYYPFIPNVPSTTHSPSNGLMIKEQTLNADRFKVTELVNNYVSSDENTVLEGISLSSSNGLCYELIPQDQWTFVHARYKEPSEWWYLASSTNYTFDLSDASNTKSLSVHTTYQYNTLHKQAIEIITHTSDGRVLKNTMRYPLDEPLLCPPQMWNESLEDGYRHRHSDLITSMSYVDNVPVSGVRNTYEVGSGGINKSKIEVYERSVFKDEYSLEYDGHGNIKQMRKENDVNVTFIWSYNRMLPVAKVMNATYAEVVNALTFEVVDLISTGSYSDQQLYDMLAPLYTTLPKARMTIYTYNPHGGVTRTYDEGGKLKVFQYDDLQRLESVMDSDLQLVLKYKYGYRQ